MTIIEINSLNFYFYYFFNQSYKTEEMQHYIKKVDRPTQKIITKTNVNAPLRQRQNPQLSPMMRTERWREGAQPGRINDLMDTGA